MGDVRYGHWVVVTLPYSVLEIGDWWRRDDPSIRPQTESDLPSTFYKFPSFFQWLCRWVGVLLESEISIEVSLDLMHTFHSLGSGSRRVKNFAQVCGFYIAYLAVNRCGMGGAHRCSSAMIKHIDKNSMAQV